MPCGSFFSSSDCTLVPAVRRQALQSLASLTSVLHVQRQAGRTLQRLHASTSYGDVAVKLFQCTAHVSHRAIPCWLSLLCAVTCITEGSLVAMSEDPRAERIVAAIRQIPDFPKPVRAAL